ncbi:galactokinase [Bacillus atrophaeus]|uniref:galactokinase n=1 Tax=Bacillus atrophaeus TaxID=1452 RepID=UPI000D03A878|nr:galactokinase [Bacillus atrophaeus]MCY7945386.1 galactokinase [Bacillus atrophaeus]MCY8098160.1 galactokinase [Bacillus atrophaeus]MCY8463420.1 galactokinase [Bacillus atrophaeus]MCY8477303.1 galactokinase [Bacillus atrophaeus]MCY8496935.1 galactokinase [Bacillus atrophaeus]
MREEVKGTFASVFGKQDGLRFFFAPGRVNIIGEHTDYNGGHVFPCALTIGTFAAVSQRKDRLVRMFSENFKETGVKEFKLDDLRYNKDDDWANYPKGVIFEFQQRGYAIPNGFDIAFSGNIPNGAGLSSSASIELLMAVVLQTYFHPELNALHLVKMAQHAENTFIGVNCGIMDQFAIGMGKKGHAMLLNCDTLSYEYSKLDVSGLSLVIANTNKKRSLAGSSYNARRQECQEALRDLKTELEIASLGELSPSDFDSYAHLIQNETNRRRAKHAVYENDRTIKTAEMFKKNKLDEIGSLMKESHLSLKNDYEVTSPELDELAYAAWSHEGVIGSRMTGAGFGGCTISIVKDQAVEDFIEKAGAAYKERTGIKADFYVADIGEGARELKGD